MPTIFLYGAFKNMIMSKLKNTKTKDFQVDSPKVFCLPPNEEAFSVFHMPNFASKV
jgi:hypothetical protein